MSNLSATQPGVDPTTADLRVYLLGSPTIEAAGAPLSIPRRQARALLYRLAVRLRVVSREHLCFLFWPDVPESTARRNLSRLLTHLRRALPVSGLLLAQEDHVWLDFQRVWSDTVVFERLSSVPKPDAQFLSESGHLETLQQVVELYRGLFLSGFSLPGGSEFETWVRSEESGFKRTYLEALAALIEENTVRGAYATAIAYAQRYLAADELAEDVHRSLIHLYAVSGDRSAALRQYERCSAVLERELGVRPLPETQILYQTVLKGQFAPRPVPTARLNWARPPGSDVPLVGRGEMLSQLEEAFARASSGHGQVVLISGEPGIGKSRLLQESATRLGRQALVLVGAAYPGAQSVPYQPIVEALRPLIAGGRARETASPARPPALSEISTAPVWLSEASRLLPELRVLYPELPPLPIEMGLTPSRLFEALFQVAIGLASSQQTLVLCLEDLHWADDGTLRWLAYLGQRLPGALLLVVGTYASQKAEAVGELRHALAQLGALCEIELAGLDVEAVIQLLHHMVGPLPNDKALAGRLQQATGGNPFFLIDILRALTESSGPPERLIDLEELPLTEAGRGAVEGRLRRLSPVSRQVLEAGAVLGQIVDFELVLRTAGRGEIETIDALDELVTRQLLVGEATGYRFQHEIVRAAVYRKLSYWRRRLLHRRAGEALQKLQVNDPAILAWHFEQAEESSQAAKYAMQAGLAAKAVFANAEARIYFDRALAHLKQERAGLRELEAIAANQRLQVQALAERGWAFRLLGDMEAYARDSEEVAGLAEQLGDQCTLAHLRWREAYTHRWFCRYTEARRAAGEGIRLVQGIEECQLLAVCREAGSHLGQGEVKCPLEAMCLREVGMAAREMGDYEAAQAFLETALTLFVALGEVVYEIHTLCNLSTLYWRQGENERAMDLARRALVRCEEAGLRLEARLPLGDIGAAATALGETDLARKCLEESLGIARQIADRTQEILCLGHLGWLEVRLKRPAKALERLKAALALTKEVGSCTEQSWLLLGLGAAYYLADDLDQAEKCAHRALALAEAHGRAFDQELARKILSQLKRPRL